MTTKQVVIAFLVLYLLLMGVGGAMYYAIQNPPKPKVEAEVTEEVKDTEDNKDNKETKNIEIAEANKKELEEKAEKAKKEAELAAQRKKEEDERKAKEAEDAKLEDLKEDIEGKMKVITRGGITFYTHNRGKELSGVHLRPFIAEKNGTVILKHDIYYHSALDDPNFGWIHGSHLDVTADGAVYSYDLDPSERRDKLSKDAENLTESYVMNADKNIVEMLKAVGRASNVTLHYYGDADIVSTLSRADIRRINEMVTLYEIKEKEANGDL